MQSESEARENPRTDGEPSPTNEELAARVKAGTTEPLRSFGSRTGA